MFNVKSVDVYKLTKRIDQFVEVTIPSMNDIVVGDTSNYFAVSYLKIRVRLVCIMLLQIFNQ
jgi:hypothetical protein